MKIVKKLENSVMFSLMSMSLVSSVFASNATQFPVCNYNVGAVIAVTFSSNEECRSFEDTATVGAAGGYAYGNCSVSTYCLTFKTAGALDLEGRSVSALSGASVGGTKLRFSTPAMCSLAMNATTTNGVSACEESVLYLSTNGYGGRSFSTSVEGLNVTGLSSLYD